MLFNLFAEFHDYEVELGGIVLKPNMVLPGTGSGQAVTPDQVACRTVDAFSRIVPQEIAGIAFLSGGQGAAAATANLAALQRVRAPWPLTFSFGRALAGPALAAWGGARGPGSGRPAGSREPGGLQPGRAARGLPAGGRGKLRPRLAGDPAVRTDHADRTGTIAVTVVPVPGRDVTLSLPPISSARSVMLRRP